MPVRIHLEGEEFRSEQPIKSDQYLAVQETPSVSLNIGEGRFWVSSVDHQPRFTPSEGDTITISGGTEVVGFFSCPEVYAVGTLVQTNGSNIVKYASQSGVNIGRVVGIISAKLTTVTCNVVYIGEVGGLTVVANQKYYLGVDGVLTTTPPTDSGKISQFVGIGKNSTTLIFIPEPPTYL